VITAIRIRLYLTASPDSTTGQRIHADPDPPLWQDIADLFEKEFFHCVHTTCASVEPEQGSEPGRREAARGAK
jgi:hypothetical protein